MPKLLSNKSDIDSNNLEGWEKYIKFCANNFPAHVLIYI